MQQPDAESLDQKLAAANELALEAREWARLRIKELRKENAGKDKNKVPSLLGSELRVKYKVSPSVLTNGKPLLAWIYQPFEAATELKVVKKQRNKTFRKWDWEDAVNGKVPRSGQAHKLPVALPFYGADKVLFKLLTKGHTEVDPLKFQVRLNAGTEKLVTKLLREGRSTREVYKALLTAESANEIAELHAYDMSAVLLRKVGHADGNNLFQLEVPGLAEKRPSVLYGDEVLAMDSKTSFKFKGYVHHVERNTLTISFHETFRKNARYDIQFVARRSSYRQMMRVLSKQWPELPAWITTPIQAMPVLEQMTLENTGFLMSYVDSGHGINKVCRRILGCGTSHVGFDLEWDSMKLNYHPDCIPDVPAVLQLAYQNQATGAQYAVVCHILAYRNKPLPFYLRKLLLSPSIIKVGVGILEHDLPRIKKHFIWTDEKLQDKSFLDLQHEIPRRKINVGFEYHHNQTIGMRHMVEYFLQKTLDKDKRDFLWHQSLRTFPEQQRYAAIDAIAALLIYNQIRDPMRLRSIASKMERKKRTAIVYKSRRDDIKVNFINSQLVVEQKMAVSRMLSSETSQPLVIFGPPGTGKTTTLVEGILQLVRRSNHQGTILVCATTNSAADHIACGIANFQTKIKLLRMNAYTRSQSTVPLELKEYCLYDGQHYLKPSVDEVHKYDVIVSTTCNVGTFISMGVPAGQFSTIILDEAGQAMQPESLIPLSFATKHTNVVLAGDPKQLGALVKCQTSQQNGLAFSLLEKLIAIKNDSKEKIASVILLVQTFRAHPKITSLYSDLFYDSKLISKAPKMHANLFLHASFLPNPAVPYMFVHVESKHQYEANAPSIYNSGEVDQVMSVLHDMKAHSPRLSNDEIGIISPYLLQVKKLRQACKKYDGITIDVTEKFQGQEKAAIIVSVVRSFRDAVDVKHNLGFLTDSRRLNVSISRSRSLLVLVGNAKTLLWDPSFRYIIKTMLKNNAVLFNGLTSKSELEDLIYNATLFDTTSASKVF